MTPDLECQHLIKRFGETQAVDDVSFSVPQGSFFSILGPSGCGKTTIMRMIAGFLEPSGGDILIRGKSVLDTPPNKRPVNMVFQHLALFPMMSVADNIGYGLRRQGMAKAEIARRVEEMLHRINLPGLGQRKINELSGGQKQRIAIARCMILNPDVLLLDEPLGALDLKLREHMKIELKALQSEFDTTFVYITHDQSEALVMSDQIAVMNTGRFEQVGSGQELYYNPQTAFVAGFVGESNRWIGRVERIEGREAQVLTENGLTIFSSSHDSSLMTGDQVEIFVRPEAIRLSKKAENLYDLQNRLSGKVVSVLFNGAASNILFQAEEELEPIEVALPQSGEMTNLARGAEVAIGWTTDQARCFKWTNG